MQAQLTEAPTQDGFPVWKTVTIQPATWTFARESMTERGWNIWSRAPRVTAAEELDLVRIKVADLGYPDDIRYKNFCAAAQKRGLMLCPPEVAVELRPLYPEQPKGGNLHIGMEAISWTVNDPGGEDYEPSTYQVHEIFVLVRNADGTMWIHGGDGEATRSYHARDWFVFVKPKTT